ncbi:hypothetical protein FJTKL_00514 [Diaporthe vaccinii]|uniref:Uncharacterized protein n=1 Tax=Diaporthe vaccinii TaxID=105482 RepID=A0ABR4E2W9_9PEZI
MFPLITENIPSVVSWGILCLPCIPARQPILMNSHGISKTVQTKEICAAVVVAAPACLSFLCAPQSNRQRV